MPELAWYIREVRLVDESLAAYECTCCYKTWKPYEIETHRADCKRKLGPPIP